MKLVQKQDVSLIFVIEYCPKLWIYEICMKIRYRLIPETSFRQKQKPDFLAMFVILCNLWSHRGFIWLVVRLFFWKGLSESCSDMTQVVMAVIFCGKLSLNSSLRKRNYSCCKLLLLTSPHSRWFHMHKCWILRYLISPLIRFCSNLFRERWNRFICCSFSCLLMIIQI